MVVVVKIDRWQVFNQEHSNQMKVWYVVEERKEDMFSNCSA
jgi:hypothetical protein